MADHGRGAPGVCRRMAIPIIGVRCHYCSKFYPRSHVVNFGKSMVRCWKCHGAHLAALEVIAGNPPKGCGVCGVTFEALAERTAGEEVGMFMHYKDGLYQLLCSACDRVYVPKRKDLYGPTQFGWDRKLS